MLLRCNVYWLYRLITIVKTHSGWRSTASEKNNIRLLRKGSAVPALSSGFSR
nr:MAG TPA: hypothetical protein [Inoviridae sp.]